MRDNFPTKSVSGLAASDLLVDWDAWRRAAGVPPGTPYLISPTFEFDVELNAFFYSTDMLVSEMSTRVGYAGDLKAFLNFLEHARGVSNWRTATAEDHRAYLIWRREDPAGPRVSGSTWNREVSAVDRFYRWQHAQGHVTDNPIPHRALRARPRSRHASSHGDIAATYSHSARREQVRWLPSRSYRVWRDVGLRGHAADGLPDPRFRGRWADRNAVFSDLMVRTGMRLTEQSSLTVVELPKVGTHRGYKRFWLPSSVAKAGSGRWVYIPSTILRDLHNYAKTDRRVAIERAQQRGLYTEHDKSVWLLDDRHIARTRDGGARVELAQLTTAERARLLVMGPSGWEPASLWISEMGSPIAVSSWKDIFRQANQRCEKHGRAERAHPHMLRHTFAVLTLEQMQRGHIAALAEMNPAQRTEYTQIFGDPLVWLKNRLGHRSVTTTQIYLHALEELEMETRMALVPDTWDDPRDDWITTTPDSFPNQR